MKHSLGQRRWARIERPETTVGFVLSREQPAGGFSFARQAPPTLEDTYHALEILRLLGGPAPSRRTRGFVADIEPTVRMTPRLLHELVSVRRACGVPRPPRALLERVIGQGGARDRVALFERADLADVSGVKVRATPALRRRLAKIRPDHRSGTVIAAQTALACKLLRIPLRAALWREWLAAAQGLDGGYGFVPGSTSFLEATAIVVRAFEALSGLPRNLAACEEFVLRCRSRDGGFGRTSQAVPTLEATYLALTSLRILHRMRSHPSAPVFTAHRTATRSTDAHLARAQPAF